MHAWNLPQLPRAAGRTRQRSERERDTRRASELKRESENQQSQWQVDPWPCVPHDQDNSLCCSDRRVISCWHQHAVLCCFTHSVSLGYIPLRLPLVSLYLFILTSSYLRQISVYLLWLSRFFPFRMVENCNWNRPWESIHQPGWFIGQSLECHQYVVLICGLMRNCRREMLNICLR